MNYFPRLRRAYILWRLATVGEVQRDDISRIFGTSIAQSSGDIRRLLIDYPEALRYDTRRKRYVSHLDLIAVINLLDVDLAKMASSLRWS